MRKLFIFLFIVMATISYSNGEYNFPIKDPYKSTIIGSEALTVSETSKKVPRKVYSMKIPPFKKPPKSMWYEDSFKFSAVLQKEKAPLIFVIAGTGSTYESKKMKDFEKVFYSAGYSVISISSPMSQNFLITASSSKVPGLPMDDSKDLYRAMMFAYEKVRKKVDVSEFYLTGYSLGATESAYLSYLDETKKVFNFKRVLLINPAVNLFTSAKILDDMLDNNVAGGREHVDDFIVDTIDEIAQNGGKHTSISEEVIYKSFKEGLFDDKQMETLIGVAFRFTAVDLNYSSDMFTGMGVYTKTEPKKFQEMTSVFERINGASFIDYIKKIGYPYYKRSEPNLKYEDLIKRADMRSLAQYLKTSDKIAMVTNKDEIILNEDDKKFLKDTFKGREIIYPYGGHCGNMFYRENVDNMIRFFRSGRLVDES